MRPPRPGHLFALALALATSLVAGNAAATTYRQLLPEPMVLRADLVFLGTVTTVEGVEVDGRPWTAVGFGDLTVLRDRAAEADGRQPADALELRFLGGSATLLPALIVSGLPTFTVGERWLLLAYQETEAASPVVGVAQGAWRLDAAGWTATDGSHLAVDADGHLVAGGGSTDETGMRAALTAVLERGAPTEPAGPAETAETAETGTDEAPGDPAPGSPQDAPDSSLDAAPAPGQPRAGPPRRVEYRVDDSGGPLLLSTEVAAAAQAWVTAAPGAAEFTVDPAAPAVIRYGTAELLGPDAASLTLVSRAGQTEVLLSPQAGSLLRPALLHELGVLLGLQEGGAGVMAWTAQGGVTGPTATDVALLEELRGRVPEDLNGDGQVDFYDLVLVGQAYGQTGVNLQADLNGDGRVDDADLQSLREAYVFDEPRQTAP